MIVSPLVADSGAGVGTNTTSAASAANAFSNLNKGGNISGKLAIDFTRPDVVPPFESVYLGVFVGCAFSALGAVGGTLVVRACGDNADLEVLARGLNNVIACFLVLVARLLIYSMPSLADDFILMKVMTSGCGALSSMSGTI